MWYLQFCIYGFAANRVEDPYVFFFKTKIRDNKFLK